MTLAQKIAQLFVLGFRGMDVSETSNIARAIAEFGIGGVILFDVDMVHGKPVNNIESPEQVRQMVQTLKGYSDIPLLVGIDQEGGKVNRLKPDYGFPPTRSHRELGETGNPAESYREGLLIATTLKTLGINLNFAPVVDIVPDAAHSPIGEKDRSFGATPEIVIQQAEAFIKAHHQKGILTCCKHFPGLGTAHKDTHLGFVDITDTWKPHETEPYRRLTQLNLCPLVMTTHAFNKHLDAQYPATLSEQTIQGFLRQDIGYNGVVISDDMQMKAISDHYGLKEALRLGIKAGLDLFCFGNNLIEEKIEAPQVIELVLELVEEGSVTEARIDQSVARILALKENWREDSSPNDIQ